MLFLIQKAFEGGNEKMKTVVIVLQAVDFMVLSGDDGAENTLDKVRISAFFHFAIRGCKPALVDFLQGFKQ